MIYTYEIQKTVNGKKIKETIEVEVEIGQRISGTPSNPEIRRLLKLPLSKQLVYYKHRNGRWIPHNVEYVEFDSLYDDWFVLLVDGVRIHSAFFAHMQKPSFVSDMESGHESAED